VSKVNVVVIGGGPAGSAAAITCAQWGLEVTLIERAAFPREHPGETLHPGIEPLLKKLGVEEQVLAMGFLRHLGHWVQWADALRFVPYGHDEHGPWMGFQAWRADFDAILLEKAKSLGVEVLQPCRASQLIVEQGTVLGVITPKGALRSSFVIDATGSQHWLARQLGLTIQAYTPPLTVHYGYAKGTCPACDQAPSIVADPQGWTWTAQIRPQLYQWTRLAFQEESLNKEWMPSSFEGLTPQRLGKADVTWRKIMQPAGLGYFIAGDAFSILDPASSHGVLKAMMSGMMAGYLVVQVIKNRYPQEETIRHYHQWMHHGFEHDIEKLKSLYKILPNPPAWI
jgi:flavin-dependent dehydrogenase